MICEYGDESFNSFAVINDINNPDYKKSYGKLSDDQTNGKNTNVLLYKNRNKFILANTEFISDALLKSINILPSEIGSVNLSIITFLTDCSISCSNHIQSLDKLERNFKLSTNMTFEFKNLSLHTFYFDLKVPYEAGYISEIFKLL